MRMNALMPATQSVRSLRSGIPGKRAINLSLSSDVLEAAKGLKINIYQVYEHHLREVVLREQEHK